MIASGVLVPFDPARGAALAPRRATLRRATLAQMIQMMRLAGAGAAHAELGALSEQKVDLSLPRFKARTGIELRDVLVRLGMKLPFAQAADFGGISRSVPLQISAVIHEAVIDVDEAGTTAAAATAVVMRAGGPPAPVSRCTSAWR